MKHDGVLCKYIDVIVIALSLCIINYLCTCVVIVMMVPLFPRSQGGWGGGGGIGDV